jgi:3-hydroxybutyrate dehydrogenase
MGAFLDLAGSGDPEAIERQRRSIEATKPVEIADMISDTEKTFGAIDVLVNNAGIQFVAKVEEFPVEKWDAVIATNLSAAFHTCRCVLPGMKRRGWGRIINIASAHGLVASAGKAAYVAAKHGVVGLTKVVAIETADHGITCNAICSGWVITPLVAQQVEARANAAGQSFDEAKQEFVAEKQPMARYTRPEDIGALAVFLAGDAAATITGASYSIDGGWTAQ